jgi:hypothetical protein
MLKMIESSTLFRNWNFLGEIWNGRKIKRNKEMWGKCGI